MPPRRRASAEGARRQLDRANEKAEADMTPERRRVVEMKAKMRADDEHRKQRAVRQAQRKLRSDYIFMADTACKAGRYDDMLAYFKLLITVPDCRLGFAERALLQMAMRENIGARRLAYQKVMSIVEVTQRQAPADIIAIVVGYADRIKNEIVDRCQDVLDIVEEQAKFCTGRDFEAKACFHKIKGDCLRYLCESEHGERRHAYATKCNREYGMARQLALNELPAAHPTRLGIMLNLAIMFNELHGQRDKATALLRVTYDETIDQLDEVHREGSSEYTFNEDTTVLLQQVRRTLVRWTSQSKHCHLTPPKPKSVFQKQREKERAAKEGSIDWNRTTDDWAADNE